MRGKARLKKNAPAKTSSVSVQTSGQITVGQELPPTDDQRIKDSRKVRFDYQRALIL
jgi:hypothetical protein